MKTTPDTTNGAAPPSPLSKKNDLLNDEEEGAGKVLTTNQGTRVNDNQNTLKAGFRGPSLLEDFHFREKITHFDHERIPERVVHARGSAAHGYFQVYESMARYTRASFLQDPSVRTPVFVRFSTVAGSRGSTDLARDPRGFAVKFYTDEGVFDLVGNNMPVFFIQDAIKFPDLVHAVKPEQDNEMPTAASAHDTFWDFISLMPESAHMVMWLMSDRAIPRSYRMMEGFGVHTFRLVDASGTSRFVKFHWKPLLGVHSVVWEEAQMISGNDPDFHRRDLWEAIEQGNYPEYELGVQVVEESDEHAFDFDLLDPTKIIPEEVVPVERIGRLVLNRNPENFSRRRSRSRSTPGTSCRASTSRTIRSSRAGSSRTPTRSSCGSADRTSTRSRSTARSHRSTTTSARVCTATRSIAARPRTSRTRSAAAARCRRGPRRAGSRAFPSNWRARRCAVGRRSSSITSARRRCSSRASRRSSRITS
jgi:catalase